MKPRLVIIGAGLGGCFLADGLADNWDITVVEMASRSALHLQDRIKDIETLAVTHPHIGTGLGGTTAFWHNGILEPTAETFVRYWPIPKDELEPYYEAAYPRIAGISRAAIRLETDRLRLKYAEAGIPVELFRSGLFYPMRRIHAWNDLKLAGRVAVVDGEVLNFVPDGENGISAVVVATKDQRPVTIPGDVFVLAAGGIGTPLLLQRLAKMWPALSALKNAGRYYEDHPSVVVGEVVLREPLYKLWNYPTACTKGNLRLPLTIEQDGLQVSFQLRPAAHFWIINPRNRVKTVLHDLRNHPLRIGSYFKLLTHWDDVLEILSFKFGVRWPTRHYSIVMVAEQPPSVEVAIWQTENDSEICRRWTLTNSYLEILNKSIDGILRALGDKINSSTIFPDWPKHITSSSHHSGTARMASSPDHGVCDQDGCVFGTRNLYVCDGSLIPSSGYANTGLTIAALALRLADHFKRRSQ